MKTFYTVHEGFMARILRRFAIPSSSGWRFVGTAMTHPSWVTLHGMARSFAELHKLLHHDRAVILEGDHNKGLYRQGYNLPRVMYNCESWTVKKAECQRIDVFELGCWRRLLKFSWTAKRTNQSIWREINPAYSLEGLTLKLWLQYFGHLM